MTIIKFRSGSNQPCSEVSHLKKLTVEQVMRRCPSYQRHYFLIRDFLSYFMGEMLTNFIGKRMRDRPETDRFSDYVLSVLKAIFLEILRVILS